MKITKQSFQAFFTRTSFAGLLLVTGAAGVRAQSTATEEREALRDFSFERVFSTPVGNGGSVFGVRSGWRFPETLFPGAGARGDRRASTDKVKLDWMADSAAPADVGTLPAATVTTSGTLSAQLTATTNYSAAPWVITTGDGTSPDLGGVATFAAPINTVVGSLANNQFLTIDVSPTLSGITYNDPFSTSLNAPTAGGTSIIAASTGLTLNAQLTAISSPQTVSLSTNAISSPISGGGTAGLIKTGSGIVNLTGANTYTGGTTLNGGSLIIGGTAANGDKVLGATGAGNDLTFNGGTLFTNVTGGLTTARNITLGANGGTIEANTAFTTSGVVSGTGTLSINGYASTGIVTLTNTNTYTGATITSLSVSGGLTLSGNGSIATSSSYDLSSTLTLDNSGTTGIDRISDTAPIITRGGLITTTGNANTASAETVGAITLANGTTTINVAPGTAGSTLTTASLTRQSGSTLFVRGTNLGATPGAGNATILSTAAPAMVGGGGLAGTTMISIVPWALGNLTASTATTPNADIGTTAVTYDPVAGFRPLTTMEYASTLGVSAMDNVRLTATTTTPTGATANSLLLAPAAAGAFTISGGPINVTSGSVIYSPAVTGTITTPTISANLNFGAAEGVIQYTNTLAVSGAISGTGGLTLASPSFSGITLTGASTYTGPTNLVSGTTTISGSNPITIGNDGVTPGPFGEDTSAINLTPGSAYVVMASNAETTTTFNRNLVVTGAGPAAAYFGDFSNGSGIAITMNGNISLQHSLVLCGGVAANPTVFNGTISGTGGIMGYGTLSYDVINGNNTFTGNITTRGDTFILGSDTALGNGGTILNAGTSTFEGSGTAARNIPNNWILFSGVTYGGTAPLTISGNVNLNGGYTVSSTDTAGAVITGVVSNGALTKGGAGALSLNSPTGNTYTAGTQLGSTAGALLANNTSGSAFGPGTLNIQAGSQTSFATLAGNFTTSGTVSIGGRVSPGNSGLTAATAGVGAIGTDNFTTLTLSSATASSLYLEAAGTGAGNYDTINVGGVLTLNGTVYIATTGGYTIKLGDTFTFVNAGSITQGTFTFNTSNAAFASFVGLSETVTGTQIIATAIMVPEPGTWTTVAAGLGLLGGLQFARRRNRRAD